MRILLLGGSTEASQLARLLEADESTSLTLSFAGRTAAPRMHAAQVRVGGFGGVVGLVDYLRNQRIELLIDATHPFAAVMPFHAADASKLVDVPLLKLYRPAWPEVEGDRWTRVPDLQSAARALETLGARRVLLTTGRTELDPFRQLLMDFVVRSIEPPDLHGFAAATAVRDRGPFALDSERALLVEHSIDVLVTKNSGGAAAAPKLKAARQLRISVVMVERPPTPDVACVESVNQAVEWITAMRSRAGTSAA